MIIYYVYRVVRTFYVKNSVLAKSDNGLRVPQSRLDIFTVSTRFFPTRHYVGIVQRVQPVWLSRIPPRYSARNILRSHYTFRIFYTAAGTIDFKCPHVRLLNIISLSISYKFHAKRSTYLYYYYCSYTRLVENQWIKKKKQINLNALRRRVYIPFRSGRSLRVGSRNKSKKQY